LSRCERKFTLAIVGASGAALTGFGLLALWLLAPWESKQQTDTTSTGNL